MYIHTLQDSLFIGHRQSLGNARSIAFSQCTSYTHLTEDETFNSSDIINHFMDYEDGQQERVDLREWIRYIYRGTNPTNRKSICFKNSTNPVRSLESPKELRSCISGYRNVHKQLTNRPS
ncbi:hypothetical protein TNCV_4502321 [Trichonephila clavipes]|nr:hypothetical protein TNCV_4502321 [Trichonephila clavipes]